VIDDERLQELLARGSSLYNNGEYKGAIDAWREALAVDPSSQKAKEGIRMATLLMGDWEPQGPAASPEEAPAASDGATQDEAGLSPEEMEAKLDLGIARVKQLLAQRKYAEAIEGARGLLPLSPESEEVHRLLEEAQHAFESAPFVEEHLTLARELMAQDRYPEAETECKKVFTLDATHPGARVLLAQIREKIQGHLKRAADQLGGMTVKLTLPDVLAAGKGGAPKKSAATKPPASAPAPSGGGFAGDIELDGGDDPAIPLAGAVPKAEPLEDGRAAASQEEVAARSALEKAFEQAGVAEEPGVTGEPGAMEPERAPGGPEPLQETVVEARTVVPPSVRLVPRSPAKPAGASGKPAASAAKPADAKPAPPAEPAPAGAEETAWETELAQLNIKQGERDLLRGTAARVAKAPPDAQADVDLMSLLDTDLGGMPEAASDQAVPTKGGAIPVSGTGASVKPAGPPAPPRPAREAPRAATHAMSEAPAATPRERPAGRPRTPPHLPGPKPRSSVPRFFAFLGLLLLAGAGAAWWFLFQPRVAGGAGSAGGPGAPPSGSPSGAVAAQTQGAIPTPIGSTSRQPQDPQGGSPAGSGAAPAPQQGGAALAAQGQTPPDRGARAQGGPAPGPGGTTTSPHAPAGAPSPAPGAPLRIEPIKPAAPPPIPPEEMRRRVAAFMADGRRLVAAGKWREARAKLSAAIALDPANFEAKDLLDRTQAKIDEDQRLLDDFDSAKKAFTDKDYENALRKYYRLPRDKGLGDIDRYIRNAWFNWAVVSMKAGNATDALLKLKELLEVDPDDAEALKLQEVGEHYVSRAKDRVYYAFTDTLRLRAFDQK